MKRKFFKRIKEKHNVYEKSVCIDGEWKKEELRRRGKKE